MPLWSFLFVANYYCVEQLAFRQLRCMLVIVYLFCKTLGMGDRALMRSVACCDSYWCITLHPWESKSAIYTQCAISLLPRVLLSFLSLALKRQADHDRASHCHFDRAERVESPTESLEPQREKSTQPDLPLVISYRNPTISYNKCCRFA